MFWPARLAIFYPQKALNVWQLVACAALLAAISLVCLRCRKSMPFLLVGWLWYLIALLPVVGFVQVGLQAHADRYTYLPQIGLYLAIGFALAEFHLTLRWSRILVPIGATCVILLLTRQSARQAALWSSTESLWTHAADVVPNNAFAEYNLAAIALQRDDKSEAIRRYDRALASCPEDDPTHSQLSAGLVHANLGALFLRQDQFAEAEAHLRKAITLQDDLADAHANLGTILARRGDLTKAIVEYEKALAIPPEDAPCHLALASLFWRIDRKDKALAHYRRAQELDPKNVPPLSAIR